MDSATAWDCRWNEHVAALSTLPPQREGKAIQDEQVLLNFCGRAV
jgi:hypothetical protein